MSNQTFGEEPTRVYRDESNKTSRAHSRVRVTDSLEDEGTASTLTSEVQGVLDQQVMRGAKTMTHVAQSARRAADELEIDAPQIAGLVRGMADRLEEYSRTLETQSAADIYEAASNFTRCQPAVVFGAAALAGFFALRMLKSSSTSAGRGDHIGSAGGEDFHGS
jgi:hypothetical protein